MINILLIGNGAREHVIAQTLKKNPRAVLFACMKTKNPGIAKLSKKCYLGDLLDVDWIVKVAKENKINFAFVGPEAPLEVGVVDELAKAGIPAVGPHKELAQLETSKSFTRDLLEKHNIPGNPRFKVFFEKFGIREFMEELDSQYVVKADGLMGGKGVKVFGDHFKNIDEGCRYAEECLIRDTKVVIEEKLAGEEFSLQCFCDGKTIAACPAVQDHKRAYVGDIGPNTGGMGSYSDSDHLLPFLKKEDVKQAIEITKKVAIALNEETGIEYKGIMYGGFMATKNGVKLIEYNARLGDPEAMNVLPLLKTDLVDVAEAIIKGTLDKLKIEFDNKATVCKYAVPEGYPDNTIEGEKIDLSNVPSNVKLYYANVDQKEDGLYMTTSRAVAFVGVANTINDAEKIAENGVKSAKGRVFHRKDIGTRELIEKRIQHMKELN